MSERFGRRRASLDDAIDAVLGEVASAEPPDGLPRAVATRLARLREEERPRHAWSRTRWLAPALGAVPALVLLVVCARLVVPEFFGQPASPGTPTASHAGPPGLQPSPAAPPAATGAAARSAAGGGPAPSAAALNEVGGSVSGLIDAIWPRPVLARLATSKAPGARKPAEQAADAGDRIAIDPLAIDPIATPKPVTIAVIEITPIQVPAIAIPALDIKPLGAAPLAQPGETGVSRQ
jgi:hypothetical protein